MSTSRGSFQKELYELRQNLLEMGALVESSIHRAVTSLARSDLQLAEQVIADDDIVDAMQLRIETKCLNLIALQQPVAKDLRVIGTALKIVTDLERMADHATDIAYVTLQLKREPLIKPLVDIPRMAHISQEMVHNALTAYITEDLDLALSLSEQDNDVDHLYNQVFRELLIYMIEDPRNIRQATHLLFVAQHLERISDHATNIGEWIVYMVSGERKSVNAPSQTPPG